MRLYALSHRKLELHTSHDTDKVSFQETLFGDQPDPVAAATFRSVLAAALLAIPPSPQLGNGVARNISTCNTGAFEVNTFAASPFFADKAGGNVSCRINRMNTTTLNITASANPFGSALGRVASRASGSLARTSVWRKQPMPFDGADRMAIRGGPLLGHRQKYPPWRDSLQGRPRGSRKRVRQSFAT
jgi:hypothetical protein